MRIIEDAKSFEKKREYIETEIHPKEEKLTFPLFPPDPYQNIKLRNYHSIEKENSRVENGQTNQLVELNAPLLNNRSNIKVELISFYVF